METKTENRGGKRPRAGRKPAPISEKKQTIIVYIPNKVIEKLGGKDKVRYLAEDAINAAYTRTTEQKRPPLTELIKQ